MSRDLIYTTQLQAGLGMIEETKTLLGLWKPGMKASDLFQVALDSGSFSNVTARRLRNIVFECFSPRYLTKDDYPALLIKKLLNAVSQREFSQLLYLYTARANPILADFVGDVYWSKYIGGNETISNEDARDFVVQANQYGKTTKHWSESTIKRVSSYLTGCCADFGMLDTADKGLRRIIPYRAEPKTIAFLAYDLHFSGCGNNAVISHTDWKLFGLNDQDVINEFKQLSLKGYFIFQNAGNVVQISWAYKKWEGLIDVISQN